MLRWPEREAVAWSTARSKHLAHDRVEMLVGLMPVHDLPAFCSLPKQRRRAHGVLPGSSAPHGCVVARATCFFGIQNAGSCARVSGDTSLIAGSSRKRWVSELTSPSR